MEKQTEHFNSLRSICRSMESILSGCFGPKGLHSFICTDTGQVTVTNDGVTLLSSLHLSHPMAKLIIDSVKKVTTCTGDGSKTFVLILSEALIQMHDNIQTYINRSIGNTVNLSENYQRLRMIKALQSIQQDKLPHLEEYVIRLSKKVTEAYTVEKVMYGIYLDIISPQFPPKITECFIHVLLTFLNVTEKCLSCQVALLRKTLDFSSCLFVKVPNHPYTSSQCINSLVIQRNFTVHCPQESATCVCFIIVVCEIFTMQATANKSDTKIHLSQSEDVHVFMKNQMLVINSFVSRCKKHNVSLVLCTEGVPEFAQSLFQTNNISVIHFIDKEDADFLQASLQKQPITELHHTITQECLFEADSCKPIIINGHQYVHLVLPSLPQTLLVCGLSDGLCRQVTSVLTKALVTVCQCLEAVLSESSKFSPVTLNKDVNKCSVHESLPSAETNVNGHHQICGQGHNVNSSDKFYKDIGTNSFKSAISNCVVPGGGVFEYLTAYYFLREFKDNKNSMEVREMCRSLSNAFFKIPGVVFHNKVTSNTRQSGFLQEKQQVINCLSLISNNNIEDEELSNGSNEEWQTLVGKLSGETLQSLSGKLHVVYSLMQTLQQLLRIDGIIGVKKSHA